MTIIATFMSPYVIKYGWRLTDRLLRNKEIESEG
jgi:hypothetical protein